VIIDCHGRRIIKRFVSPAIRLESA